MTRTRTTALLLAALAALTLVVAPSASADVIDGVERVTTQATPDVQISDGGGTAQAVDPDTIVAATASGPTLQVQHYAGPNLAPVRLVQGVCHYTVFGLARITVCVRVAYANWYQDDYYGATSGTSWWQYVSVTCRYNNIIQACAGVYYLSHGRQDSTYTAVSVFACGNQSPTRACDKADTNGTYYGGLRSWELHSYSGTPEETRCGTPWYATAWSIDVNYRGVYWLPTGFTSGPVKVCDTTG